MLKQQINRSLQFSSVPTSVGPSLNPIRIGMRKMKICSSSILLIIIIIINTIYHHHHHHHHHHQYYLSSLIIIILIISIIVIMNYRHYHPHHLDHSSIYPCSYPHIISLPPSPIHHIPPPLYLLTTFKHPLSN
jgi:uncharacterized membrane protein YcgQ (UPF0703/DUF1980 family)